MEMRREELQRVSPWELRLMLDAADGLTNREIAAVRSCSVRSVDRTFERLRHKLRPYGGGSKPGLVHWVDTYAAAWLEANGITQIK
jgi:DNA-binding NarL/FixJ family response regulator